MILSQLRGKVKEMVNRHTSLLSPPSPAAKSLEHFGFLNANSAKEANDAKSFFASFVKFALFAFETPVGFMEWTGLRSDSHLDEF